MRKSLQLFVITLFASGVLLGVLAGCGDAQPPPSEPDLVLPTPVPPREPAEPTEPTELNLSLDLIHDIVSETDGEELVDPQILPQLVDQEALAKRVKLKGKVLTDKEALDMKDRIEGVELKIEIKTK